MWRMPENSCCTEIEAVRVKWDLRESEPSGLIPEAAEAQRMSQARRCPGAKNRGTLEKALES